MKSKTFKEALKKSIDTLCVYSGISTEELLNNSRKTGLVLIRHTIRAFTYDIKPKHISWKELRSEVSHLLDHTRGKGCKHIVDIMIEVDSPRGIREEMEDNLRVMRTAFDFHIEQIEKLDELTYICKFCRSTNIASVMYIPLKTLETLKSELYVCLDCAEGNSLQFINKINYEMQK